MPIDPEVMIAIGPLHNACHRGSSADVKKLLERGEDINEQAKSGLTPLMCACKTIGPRPGDDTLVQLLIDSKADLEAKDVLGGTALHTACASVEPINELLPKGFDKIVKMLIDAQADVNSLDKLGQTPLHRACLRGNTEAVKLLMAAGAKADIMDRSGRTAGDMAFDMSLLPHLEPPPPEEKEEEPAG
eukprot:CAMPEP_0206231198 /NCGR_PEP_ID=MMETSP0047_2-20121206/10702_1 /ASSEMBLY_ACC=CAM_ASM_000192 /TAXON_ID=195065 /ORGANISM="Chroomonas mesostigmatica_cf, Strain CCMP1168" /LENGTH=187 /DNA_ID=CAMNT_0053654747 /DNA_START=38 /DNA_END=601 /DNA_ORIENTATION=-